MLGTGALGCSQLLWHFAGAALEAAVLQGCAVLCAGAGSAPTWGIWGSPGSSAWGSGGWRGGGMRGALSS